MNVSRDNRPMECGDDAPRRPRPVSRRFVGLLSLVLTLSGCTTLHAPAPRIYQLSASTAPATSDRTPLPATLLVADPTAEPGYTSQGIAYRESAHQLSYYTRSQWADSPARMLRPALVAALEPSGLFRTVITRPTVVLPDYQLSTDILRLEQVFRTSTRSDVVFAVRVQLVNLNTRSVLGTRVIKVDEPAPTADAAGAVSAANAGLKALLVRIVAFCGKAVDRSAHSNSVRHAHRQ